MSAAIPFKQLPASVRAKIGGSAPKRTKNKLAAALQQAQAELRRASFLKMLERANLPHPIEEYRFHATRQWRFDYAWPSLHVALEVEGGIWTSGRHTRGNGYAQDMVKYNAAAVLGWCVLRVTPEQLTARSTEEMLRKVLVRSSAPDSEGGPQ